MREAKTTFSGQRLGLLVLLLAAVAILAACGPRSDRVTFNGVYYKAKAKPVEKEDVLTFAVKVPRVDRGFQGALLAGEYEATRYCLENAGTSEIDWANGPAGDEGTIPVSNNTMTFTGRCVTW